MHNLQNTQVYANNFFSKEAKNYMQGAYKDIIWTPS